MQATYTRAHNNKKDMQLLNILFEEEEDLKVGRMNYSTNVINNIKYI